MKELLKKKIKNVLKQYSSVKLAILYGSSINDRKENINDIDIAVADLKKIDYEKLAKLQLALEKELQNKVDLVDLSTINGVILQQILCKGERVICTDQSLMVPYIKKMLYFQEDMMPNYTMILKKRAEAFIHG